VDSLEFGEFLGGKIPGLIAGVRVAHAAFITYQNVANYELGDVPTNEQGLTIEIRGGDGEYSLNPYPLAPQTPGADVFAFIYAGLSGFDDSLAFVRRVKRDNPKAKIVIVTCDCRLEKKLAAIAPLSPDVIEAVVATGECGGRMTMRDILERLIVIWPSREIVERPTLCASESGR
jgi:hypothetical protein